MISDKKHDAKTMLDRIKEKKWLKLNCIQNIGINKVNKMEKRYTESFFNKRT